MKLSIIIPVYNVENSLRRCVDSVISQDYRDWQMILVDDASTDGSLEICQEYSQRDGRIQVLHSAENGGLSVARNKGIRRAKGEYITFIDSDDYISKDTLKDLMEVLTIHPDYDILEYPFYKHYGSKEQSLLSFYKREYTDMTEYWLVGKAYNHTYAWNKIYRRELFDGITFPPGKNFEDVWTLPLLLEQCHTVATTSVGMYYYCYNPNGITRQTTKKDLTSLLEAHIKVVKALHPTPTRKNFKKRFVNGFADYYASVLNILLDVTDYGYRNIDFPILPYNHTLKLRLLHILGLKRLCQLHRIFRHNH